MEELPITAAIDLLPGLICELAASNGIRTLTIKGDTLSDQGLRTPRRANDVDLWVEPDGFEAMMALVSGYGWVDRDEKVLAPLSAEPTAYAIHSVTLLHPDWPVSVDLHRYFPGFLGSPRSVFDSLWSVRDFNMAGHRSFPTPSRVDHWLLAALHALRSHDAEQLADLMRSANAFTPRERSELASRAKLLGAVEPLRPQLESLGLSFPEPDATTVRLLLEWQHAISSSPHGDLALAREFHGARGMDRWRLVHKALFPPEQTFRLFHDVRPGRSGLYLAYLRRWLLGLQHLPRLMHYLVDMTRSSRRRTSPDGHEAGQTAANPLDAKD